jgi:hypothetical protein
MLIKPRETHELEQCGHMIYFFINIAHLSSDCEQVSPLNDQIYGLAESEINAECGWLYRHSRVFLFWALKRKSVNWN